MTTLVVGLSLGCVYALIAVGFSLVFRTTGIVNFAQGTFVMIGGLAAGYLSQVANWPLALAMLAGLAAALLCGAALAFCVVVPLWRQATEPTLVVVGTFIFALVVSDVALNVFGSQPLSLPSLPGPTAHVLGTVIVGQYFWLFGVTLILVAALLRFLRRSWLGVTMQAVAEDMSMARFVGISPTRQAVLAILVSAFVGGLSGMLIAPLQYTSFSLGMTYSVMGFVAAIVGGLGAVEGGFVSGILVGLLVAFIAVDISSTYEGAIVMLVLLVLVVLRPHGLFHATTRRTGA